MPQILESMKNFDEILEKPEKTYQNGLGKYSGIKMNNLF